MTLQNSDPVGLAIALFPLLIIAILLFIHGIWAIASGKTRIKGCLIERKSDPVSYWVVVLLSFLFPVAMVCVLFPSLKITVVLLLSEIISLSILLRGLHSLWKGEYVVWPLWMSSRYLLKWRSEIPSAIIKRSEQPLRFGIRTVLEITMGLLLSLFFLKLLVTPSAAATFFHCFHYASKR